MDIIKHKKAEFDLASTGRALRAFFDAIPEVMFLLDCQGVVLQANEPFAARFGKRLAECLGRSIYDLLPPDVAAHRRKKIAEVIRTAKSLSFEGDLEGDNLLLGRKIHHICPLFGSDGEVNQLVVFSQDITDLKRKEESLRAAQEALDEDLRAMTKLREISDFFVREGDVTVVFDKVIDVARAITGAEMASIRLIDQKSGYLKIAAQQGFVFPFPECCDESSIGPCQCQNVLQLKEPITVEDITKTPFIWGTKELEAYLAEGVHSFQLTPLVSRTGKLLGILTTCFCTSRHTENRVLKLLNLLAIQTTDIIERAEKERALQHSEEQRRLAQEAAKSGSWSWDLQTNSNIWSDELWQLYGLEPHECEPSFYAWRKTLHPDDRERVEREVSEVACSGGELHTEWRVRHNDGSERWLMSRGKSVCNAEGKPVMMNGIVIDITDRKQIEEQLFESNERYSSLFRNTLNGIAYCRIIVQDGRPVDFIYEHVNARFEILTGLKNVEGRRVTEVIPGISSSSPELLEVYGRVARSGQSERFELYLEPLKMWFDISVYSTEYEHFVAVFNVITERKQAENALRESEKKFRSITEQMAEVVFVADSSGRLSYVSSAVEALFGYTSQEVVGHPFTEYLVETEIPRSLVIFNKAVLHQTTRQVYEFKCRKKNSSFFYGEFHVQYFHEEGREGIIGLIHDITERKRNDAVMEFRLRLLTLSDSFSTKEVLRITIDEVEKLTGSSVGFFHYIESDQITVSLQAWSTNTEKNCCRIEGFAGHYPLKEAGVWADAIRERRVMIHNNYDTLPHRKGMPEGHAIIKRELVVPIIRGEKIIAIIGVGNKAEDYDVEDVKLVSAMSGIAWDIIARKQAELSERRAQIELARSQKMELVGRMAGGIAHDFNNMLCVILGQAEIALLDSQHNDSLTASLQEIINAAEKSANLASQLLSFARKQPLIAKVLDLNVFVGDMLNMLRRLLGEYITLVWHPGQNLSLVSMDSSHFDQILVNLCVNARDAIVGTGTIVIKTKNVTRHESSAFDGIEIPTGEYVVLSVSDDGMGIEEENADHVFEPFFTTKKFGKGTGLGLSTVYGLVKQNNGMIKFFSEPGKGSEFIVYLPKYSGSNVSVKEEQQAEPVRPGSETILVVDDENEILKLSEMILKKQGYHVLTADSPGQAIQIAEEQDKDIHLLLTDIIMPEMNGRVLSEKIRLIYPHIKVLFMSGYTADIIATQGEVDEVMNLIQKPFSVKKLIKEVYDILHL